MSSLTITGVHTESQFGPTNYFDDPFSDELRTIVDITVSEDLIANNTLEVDFQIIDLSTNSVVALQTWTAPFNWGTTFIVGWYNTTPEAWGLSWLGKGQGVFGFRALVRSIGPWDPGVGTPVPDNELFDVSEIFYFRVNPLATF